MALKAKNFESSSQERVQLVELEPKNSFILSQVLGTPCSGSGPRTPHDEKNRNECVGRQ